MGYPGPSSTCQAESEGREVGKRNWAKEAEAQTSSDKKLCNAGLGKQATRCRGLISTDMMVPHSSCSYRIPYHEHTWEQSLNCLGLHIAFTQWRVGVLYYTILYYTILYYTILYYSILYYTILYYTILYYTILYYTIRQNKMIQDNIMQYNIIWYHML